VCSKKRKEWTFKGELKVWEKVGREQKVWLKKGERWLIGVEKRWREVKVCSKKGGKLKSINFFEWRRQPGDWEKRGGNWKCVQKKGNYIFLNGEGNWMCLRKKEATECVRKKGENWKCEKQLEITENWRCVRKRETTESVLFWEKSGDNWTWMRKKRRELKMCEKKGETTERGKKR